MTVVEGIQKGIVVDVHQLQLNTVELIVYNSKLGIFIEKLSTG